MPGPVPKPSTERRRRNSPAPVTRITVAGDAPVWPEPDPAWCPIAAQWYAAHRNDQAPFRSSSDVASLFMWAEVIDRAFRAPRLSGQLLAVIRAAEAAHGTAEGDRRRLRIELERRPRFETPGLEQWKKENL